MALDAERWRRIQALFHEALELPVSERGAHLEAACAGDGTLRAEVQALLDADSRDTSLLNRELGEVAGRVMDAPSSVQRHVGPYRIVSLLGEGGMGVVYLGERSDLGSRAAIKFLRDATLSPARRERFRIEQRTLAQLNHPSIARLYDAETLDDGTPCIVMEYVEGVPLTAWCAQRSSPLAERLRLFRAVCEAVQFAHRQAIIHRDLKPSNILVTADGTLKLLDFGIAKHLDTLEEPDQTLTGLRMMTPAYAAPEQVLGQPVGVYTDVYALGVILYELLSGRLPFDLSRRTPGQAEAVIVEQEPARPSVAAQPANGVSSSRLVASRSTWSDLDVLCLTAMHKDPQRRYRTVDALIRDIDHFVAGEPLEARPDSAGYRLGKFVRRRWRPVLAAAVVSLVVVGLVAFYTVRLAAARDAAMAEAERTERIQTFTRNLFTGGDAEAGPADTLRVIALLERGVREARALESEPAVQAEFYHTLGGLYQELGELERADSLLQLALDQRRALHGEDHTDVAESLLALGMLRHDEARMDTAEQLVRTALAMTRRHHARDHPAVITALTGLGGLLSDAGKHDDAIAVLTEAVSLQSQADTTAEYSGSLTMLANAHYYAGNYPVSDSLNRIVLGLDRRLYGERHPNVADVLINLGAIQNMLGHYPEAETLYRDALAIMEPYYGPDHPQTASNLKMLGQTLVYQERYDEARPVLTRVLEIRERLLGPDHPNVATTLSDLGSVALHTNDLEMAERHFLRMAEIYRKALGDRHDFVAVALSNLASVYVEAGDHARAEPIYRDVIDRFTDALSAENINTGIARIKLGRVLGLRAKYAEAETELVAGYEILVKQANPSVSWLQSARRSLIDIYDRTNQPEKAARYRAELDRIAAASDTT
jgi:serine/threonine-protein kinase